MKIHLIRWNYRKAEKLSVCGNNKATIFTLDKQHVTCTSCNRIIKGFVPIFIKQKSNTYFRNCK